MRQLKDGAFRVSCCKAGHVNLEVLDAGVVVFVSVMSREEASFLSSELRRASEYRGRHAPSRSFPKDVH